MLLVFLVVWTAFKLGSSSAWSFFPNAIILLPTSSTWLCGLAKKDVFNFNYYHGKLSKVVSVCLQRNIIQNRRQPVQLWGFLFLVSLPRGLNGLCYQAFPTKRSFDLDSKWGLTPALRNLFNFSPEGISRSMRMAQCTCVQNKSVIGAELEGLNTFPLAVFDSEIFSSFPGI